MKAHAATDLRAIFGAQDRAEADALLKRTVRKYKVTVPKLAARLGETLPEGLAVFTLPELHRRSADGDQR